MFLIDTTCLALTDANIEYIGSQEFQNPLNNINLIYKVSNKKDIDTYGNSENLTSIEMKLNKISNNHPQIGYNLISIDWR